MEIRHHAAAQFIQVSALGAPSAVQRNPKGNPLRLHLLLVHGAGCIGTPERRGVGERLDVVAAASLRTVVDAAARRIRRQDRLVEPIEALDVLHLGDSRPVLLPVARIVPPPVVEAWKIEVKAEIVRSLALQDGVNLLEAPFPRIGVAQVEEEAATRVARVEVFGVLLVDTRRRHDALELEPEYAVLRTQLLACVVERLARPLREADGVCVVVAGPTPVRWPALLVPLALPFVPRRIDPPVVDLKTLRGEGVDACLVRGCGPTVAIEPGTGERTHRLVRHHFPVQPRRVALEEPLTPDVLPFYPVAAPVEEHDCARPAHRLPGVQVEAAVVHAGREPQPSVLLREEVRLPLPGPADGGDHALSGIRRLDVEIRPGALARPTAGRLHVQAVAAGPYPPFARDGRRELLVVVERLHRAGGVVDEMVLALGDRRDEEVEVTHLRDHTRLGR